METHQRPLEPPQWNLKVRNERVPIWLGRGIFLCRMFYLAGCGAVHFHLFCEVYFCGSFHCKTNASDQTLIWNSNTKTDILILRTKWKYHEIRIFALNICLNNGTVLSGPLRRILDIKVQSWTALVDAKNSWQGLLGSVQFRETLHHVSFVHEMAMLCYKRKLPFYYCSKNPTILKILVIRQIISCCSMLYISIVIIVNNTVLHACKLLIKWILNVLTTKKEVIRGDGSTY